MGEVAVLLRWVGAGAWPAVSCPLCFLWDLLLHTVQALGLSFGSLSWLVALYSSAKDIIGLDFLGGITPHISPETRVMRCSSTVSSQAWFLSLETFSKEPSQ